MRQVGWAVMCAGCWHCCSCCRQQQPRGRGLAVRCHGSRATRCHCWSVMERAVGLSHSCGAALCPVPSALSCHHCCRCCACQQVRQWRRMPQRCLCSARRHSQGRRSSRNSRSLQLPRQHLCRSRPPLLRLTPPASSCSHPQLTVAAQALAAEAAALSWAGLVSPQTLLHLATAAVQPPEHHHLRRRHVRRQNKAGPDKQKRRMLLAGLLTRLSTGVVPLGLKCRGRTGYSGRRRRGWKS